MVRGAVSLKADDHTSASTDLPDDFPDQAQWSSRIVLLYEHRLRADYDNWSDTARKHSLSPGDAVQLAEEFVGEVRSYLNAKFGMSL